MLMALLSALSGLSGLLSSLSACEKNAKIIHGWWRKHRQQEAKQRQAASQSAMQHKKCSKRSNVVEYIDSWQQQQRGWEAKTEAHPCRKLYMHTCYVASVSKGYYGWLRVAGCCVWGCTAKLLVYFKACNSWSISCVIAQNNAVTWATLTSNSTSISSISNNNNNKYNNFSNNNEYSWVHLWPLLEICYRLMWLADIAAEIDWKLLHLKYNDNEILLPVNWYSKNEQSQTVMSFTCNKKNGNSQFTVTKLSIVHTPRGPLEVRWFSTKCYTELNIILCCPVWGMY